MGTAYSHIVDNLREDTWYITAWPNAGFSTSPFIGTESTICLLFLWNSKPIHEFCESTTRNKSRIRILIGDQVNMIYLGLESDRVPIIPPFGPNVHTSQLSFGRARLLYLTDILLRLRCGHAVFWESLQSKPSKGNNANTFVGMEGPQNFALRGDY